LGSLNYKLKLADLKSGVSADLSKQFINRSYSAKVSNVKLKVPLIADEF